MCRSILNSSRPVAATVVRLWNLQTGTQRIPLSFPASPTFYSSFRGSYSVYKLILDQFAVATPAI